MPPPSDVKVGDVLVYHEGNCASYSAHAVIVVEGGANAKIACHSSMHYGISYNYMDGSKSYYEWLGCPGGSEPVTPPHTDPEVPVTPVQGEKMIKVIVGCGINRRSSPSTSGSIIGGYVVGSKVQVVSQTGNWYKDTDGYYLTADPEYVTDLIATVTADGLNVRSGPGTSNSIIVVVYYGARVNVLKQNGGWYYIQSGSTRGCI